MNLPKILAIDDDVSWLSQVPLILEDQCDVTCFSSIDQGVQAIQSQLYDAILLDMNFNGDPRDGIDLFRVIQATDRGADVVVISGETRPERIVHVMKAGVTNFLPKPTTPNQIRETLQVLLSAKKLRQRSLQKSLGDGENSLIGDSLPMQRLRQEIAQVIRSGVKDILLMGETGSGKEVVARTIFKAAQTSGKFNPIHCGALSDGLVESELFGHVKGAFTGADKDRISAFESVGDGFIFFDEIGDMPLHHQAKLLRVVQERKIQRVGSLEERPVNFRSISATHVNLEEAVIKKSFRQDLYYRIAKAKIKIPSLRDRREDIPELVHHFMAQTFPKGEVSMTSDAMELLMSFHWPGNVRQLKATIESLKGMVNGPYVREGDICQVLPQITSVFGNKVSKVLVGKYGASLLNKERSRIQSAMIESLGDRDKAAKILGMSRATFYRRVKELGLIKGWAKDKALN